MENENLNIEIAKMANEILELRKLNNWCAEQFKLAQHLRFGTPREKTVLPEQMGLFNEAEVCADSSLTQCRYPMIFRKQTKLRFKL